MWPPKLDLLINILIQQFFNSSSCFIVVSDSKFSLSLPSGSVVVNTDSSSISTTVFHNFGCQNFVLDVLDPVHTFELLEHEIRRHKESLHSRKYLIVTDGNLFSEVPLSVSCHGLLVNVSKFLTRAGKEEIESSIWKLQHLAQPQVLINKWFSINQSFLWNHTIFPEEHSALKGYIIKVGTFDHPPYVVVRKNFGVNSCDIPDISGTEIEILKTIAQHLNIKLEFHLTSGLWGEIFHGKNASGLKGLIMKGVLDLGAAGFYLTERTYEYLDPSAIYLRAEVSFLVPEPRLLAPWLSPYYAFSTGTWISLLITYPILVCALFLLNGRYEGQLTTLGFQEANSVVLKMTVQQSVSRKDIAKFLRKSFIMLMLIILATMVVNIAYTGGYASVITRPLYQNSIDTLEDFLNSDLPWGSLQIADWIKAWKYEGIGRFKKTGERYVSGSPKELLSLSTRGDFGFLIERVNGQEFAEFNIDESTVERYRVIKEAIHSESITFIVRRNFALLPKINHIIQRLRQSGITELWTREASSSRFVIHKKPQQAKRSAIPSILTFEHLLGAFYILLIGQGVASVVFILEVLIKRK